MSHFLERLTYLARRREPFADDEDRMWEEGYRQRWQHDKIVRSTQA
jgi:nitrate reductase / nitrite oxidoreductase, alpha subunit